MIRLIDLGQMFWTNYFGAQMSAIQAYDITVEKLDFYWRDKLKEHDPKNRPVHVIVCCDSPVSLRKQVNQSYKANRKPKPLDAIDALTSVEDRAEKWGMPVVKCEGYEADDLIATFARQAPEDREVQIIGDEKDLYALISDRVTLWGKKGAIGLTECLAKWDVEPEQMEEFLALCGDSSDNIVGCESMGPMRAARLLNRFGTIARAAQATDGDLLELDKFGPKTVAGFRAWDPGPAMALVRLQTAPVQLATYLRESIA